MKNKKRIVIYLLISFGVSWLTALVIFLTGGLVNSPVLVANTGITLALILLATVYMWGPTIAHILTRLITREGWKDGGIKSLLKTGWKYWLIGWCAPGFLAILGALVFFMIFPGSFDPELGALQAQLSLTAADQTITPWMVVASQTLIALLLSPLLNLPATFGEEFGWRAYLLPKLAEFGKRKALILSGIIWGVWHWPVIAMGHNYGLDYSGYPWLGLLVMVWFTVSAGIFMGWLVFKSGSVWPAVFAHGSLNGMAAIGLLFLKAPASMLLGPTPAGIIGVLPFTLVSLFILLTTKD